MHTKPQSLIDSTSCCCSAQPLTSNISTHERKVQGASPPPHETRRGAVQEGSAGSRLEPCDSSAICVLGTSCHCLGEKTWMLELKRELYFTSFSLKTF